MSSAARNFAWSVAAGVAAGVIADRLREARQKKLAEKAAARQAQAQPDNIAGPLVDVFSSTFRPGWKWASVATERYSDPKGTPLDTAIRGGWVTRGQVVTYGPSAARTWILIYVPKPFRGPAAWDLDEWAQWWPASESTTLDKVIPERERESVTVQAWDAVTKRAAELGDAAKAAASAAAQAVLSPVKIGLTVMIGAAALGLFLRTKGSSR